jgi:hypothetical protein
VAGRSDQGADAVLLVPRQAAQQEVPTEVSFQDQTDESSRSLTSQALGPVQYVIQVKFAHTHAQN